MLQCIELLVLFINETVDVGCHRKVWAVGVEMQFTTVDRGVVHSGPRKFLHFSGNILVMEFISVCSQTYFIVT